MRKETIIVTQQDIFQGQSNIKGWKNASEHCAIAIALKRQYGGGFCTWGYNDGTVGRQHVRVIPYDVDRVANFVREHDDFKNVEPITFTIQFED